MTTDRMLHVVSGITDNIAHKTTEKASASKAGKSTCL